jgi:SAM-dependent methyltransferase
VDQANEFINSPENKNFHNLSFSTQNLTKLTFDTSSFDAVICRYVLEHMSNEGALESLKEIYRCVRPGGQICVIDFDGLFYNLYPQTNLVRDGFTALSQVKDFDLNIGRKLPHLMSEAGFTDLDWEIRAYEFEGENLKDEVTLIRERIALAMPMLTRTLGSSEKAHQFSIDYFKCLEQPGAVLFYNKFIITGHKTGLKIQK